MARGRGLNDEQWNVIEPLLPKRRRRADGRSRPPKDKCEVMNGTLWILRSGARWQNFCRRVFSSYQTCHRRFQQ